jgi:glutamine synthetase
VPRLTRGGPRRLDTDREFLLKGDVFTNDVIDTWIGYKRETELAPFRALPTTYEFQMYYDA